jgi:hypothetical protein
VESITVKNKINDVKYYCRVLTLLLAGLCIESVEATNAKMDSKVIVKKLCVNDDVVIGNVIWEFINTSTTLFKVPSDSIENRLNEVSEPFFSATMTDSFGYNWHMVPGTFNYNGGYIELAPGERKKFLSGFLLTSTFYSATEKSKRPHNGMDVKLSAELLLENGKSVPLFSDLSANILPCNSIRIGRGEQSEPR